MPKYNVDKEFWLGGLKQLVGSTVTLTEKQAKYLKHVVSRVGDKVPATAPAEAEAVVEPATEIEAPAAGVSVTEKPAKRLRKADADGAAN
jgi:hypothetical protein